MKENDKRNGIISLISLMFDAVLIEKKIKHLAIDWVRPYHLNIIIQLIKWIIKCNKLTIPLSIPLYGDWYPGFSERKKKETNLISVYWNWIITPSKVTHWKYERRPCTQDNFYIFIIIIIILCGFCYIFYFFPTVFHRK